MKRIIALLIIAAISVAVLAGCSAAAADADHTLRIWAAREDQALIRELADRFIAENPQYSVTITLGVVGEPDAYARFSEDPAAAADLFFFPNDQLRYFVSAGGLYEVQINADEIKARNMASAIEAATLEGRLWAYPATADNGYFLYYDKSALSEEDVLSLDRILEVSAADGKRFQMDLDNNGWYVASFFLGAGNSLSIDPDGKQICDFNNESGLAAARAMQALAAHSAFVAGNDDVLEAGIGNSITAGVSGTWKAPAIAEKLGENYGATKLPTFTLDGRQVQMGSFGGYKMVGVNAMITNAEKLVIAMELADFLTNEESQLARFNDHAVGPSNINAAASPAVQANPALAALAAQSDYATSQNDVLGNFWTPAGAFGTAIVSRDSADLQYLLDAMVAQIQS